MNEIHYLLGNTCNLFCKFCFWDYRCTDIPFQDKQKIIDNIAKTKVKTVVISGGEPLCNKDFFQVCEYLYKKGIEILLHTNGLLLTENIIRRLAGKIKRISLTYDAVSLEIIQQMRGNVFILERTKKAIELCATYNIPVNIKTMVCAVNKHEIELIAEQLLQLPIVHWSILEFIPLNRGEQYKEMFLLKEGEFDSLTSTIQERFPTIEILIRKFKNSPRKYCFVAANGDIYTYSRSENKDICIASALEDELCKIVGDIEESKYS